jgi:hypothetical protein
MIRQRPDVKTTEVVNDEKKQLEVQEGKGRIWVVDGVCGFTILVKVDGKE